MATNLFVTDATGATVSLSKANGATVESALTSINNSIDALHPTALPYTNLGAATKDCVKNSAGKVFGFRVTNTNASVRYFLLHNKASNPAATETPLFAFAIPAGTTNNPGVLLIARDLLGVAGLTHGTGVSWSIGTTLTPFTDGATASDHTVFMLYV